MTAKKLMVTAKKTVLNLLKDATKGQMAVSDIAHILLEKKLLGFGVEIMDIIRLLVKKGTIEYKADTDTVLLIKK